LVNGWECVFDICSELRYSDFIFIYFISLNPKKGSELTIESFILILKYWD